MDRKNEDQSERALVALEFTRSMLLDALQLEFGETSIWLRLRSRVLKALGTQGGLEAQLRKILSSDGGAKP